MPHHHFLIHNCCYSPLPFPLQTRCITRILTDALLEVTTAFVQAVAEETLEECRAGQVAQAPSPPRRQPPLVAHSDNEEASSDASDSSTHGDGGAVLGEAFFLLS